jgi:hypothetical protein
MLHEVVSIAAALVGGRTLLSLLPPGGCGSHRVAALPLTTSAAAALGVVASRVLVGVVPETTIGGALGIPLAPAWFAGAVALGALARLAFRPFAPVPGKVGAPKPARALDHVALAALAIACALPLASGWNQPVPAAEACALAASAAFMSFALESVPGNVAPRRFWTAIAVGTAGLIGSERDSAAFAAAAMGFGSLLVWHRRADRRALALCAVGFAILAHVSPLVALAGLALLAATTHANARRAALGWAAASAGLAVLDFWRNGGPQVQGEWLSVPLSAVWPALWIGVGIAAMQVVRAP